MITLRVEYIDLTVQLVVNLPADNTRMIAVMFSELRYDSGTELAVFGTAVIVMAAHAVL